MGSEGNRSEIVFFDLETTIPTRPGQAYAILEFGSILVCPKKLTELDSYETLVRPLDLSLISPKSIQANRITAQDVVSSPTFSEIADNVYNILQGRVWMGHNIDNFDCVRLREAFAQIKKAPPEPKRTIDTLTLLIRTFGRRAGDMKMASLAAYFGLGQQSHRSLDDVRMNFDVFKLCGSVHFLESIQQEIENNCSSLNAITINGHNRTRPNIYSISSTESHTLPSNPPNPVEHGNVQPNQLHTGPSVDKMESDILQSNEAMVEESSTTTLSNAFSNHTEFMDPDSISMASITLTIAPFVNGPNKIQILHRETPLQFQCNGMRIRFGLSKQYVDHAGNPRLSFVVDMASSSNLCNILDACDDISKRFVDSNGVSQWRPVVSRQPGFYNSPTIRLHLPTVPEDNTSWTTEIYYKNISTSPCTQHLVSSRYADVAEVESLFRAGSLVDAYFSLEPYNYQQNVGIRLVAKKLFIHAS